MCRSRSRYQLAAMMTMGVAVVVFATAVRDGVGRVLLVDGGVGALAEISSVYLINSFAMLSHSASSGSRQTGFPARPYQ
jgi:hypothetical protein